MEMRILFLLLLLGGCAHLDHHHHDRAPSCTLLYDMNKNKFECVFDE